MKKFFTLIILMCFTSTVFSQDIYIPDRPGFTYNARLVGFHQMDLEMGFGYNYMKGNFIGGPDEKTNIFYNTTAIRYGAFKHLEFRYEIDFGSVTTPTWNQSGIKGMTFGFKTPIYSVDSIINVAIVGGCYLPNIDVSVKNPRDTVSFFPIPNYSPSLTLAVQKFIGKVILFGNSGVMWDGVNPYPKGTASFALYYFPSKFGMFVETYCIYSGKSSPVNGGDLGFLYCVTDDLVVDISGGIDYTLGFDNSFINCGISWRIPNKHK